MDIAITKGIGVGPTEIAAFDQALVKAGIANYNLLYLSSVIPPGSRLQNRTPKAYEFGDWGDRLYVVMAQQRAVHINQEAWAGIGWIQDNTGRGLLVEHEGSSENTVRADIENSLAALSHNRKQKFGSINMLVAGITCVDQPVCAMTVAVFEGGVWLTKRPAQMRRTRS